MQIKWIPGYEGTYAVTDDGRVASYACNPKSGGIPIWLGQSWNERNGHKRLAVWLYKDGKKKWRYVHQLVLEAFEGPRPSGMEVCHKDDNPANNHLDNLYWGTHTENMREAMRNGRSFHPKGANPCP